MACKRLQLRDTGLLKALCERLKVQIHLLDPHDIVTTLYTTAALKYRHKHLWELLAEQARQQAPNCGAKDLCQMLQLFSEGKQYDERLFEALLLRAEYVKEELDGVRNSSRFQLGGA